MAQTLPDLILRQALRVFVLAIAPRTRRERFEWAAFLHALADTLYQKALLDPDDEF